MALESETAKEHIPADNQADYTKNPFGQRVLECITVSTYSFSPFTVEIPNKRPWIKTLNLRGIFEKTENGSY